MAEADSFRAERVEGNPDFFFFDYFDLGNTLHYL